MGKIVDFYSVRVKEKSNEDLSKQQFIIEVSNRIKDAIEKQTDEDTAKLIFQYTLALYK